ncbi:MAG: HEAT repeat domain-containing protein [Verrucomicrobia bacterium]|nr:HEAT repeat domain-containing protein [Verrucomicrobiota bacterium]
MPKLTIRLPGLPPVTHAIGGESVTVGRTPENAIQIADPSVSKAHAKLDLLNGEYRLTDLGSKNGTYVNNQRVREVLIRHTDLIKFANIEAVFEMDGLDEDIVPPTVTKPAGAGVTVTAIHATPTVISAAAPKAAPKAAPVAPGKAVTGFLPKAADAGPKPAKKMPAWLLPAAGAVLVLLVGAAVYWWMTRTPVASGGNPTAAPTPKTETNAAAPEPAAVMAAENARAAEAAAALANKPITSTDAPSIGALLRDEKPENRRNAARALHAMGKDARGAQSAIRDAVKDSDPETRFWCALALAQLDPTDQAGVPVLIEGLKSENPQLRQVASLSLAVIRFQADESAPVLELLRKAAESDENEDVRKAASSAVKLLSAAAKLANP